MRCMHSLGLATIIYRMIWFLRWLECMFGAWIQFNLLTLPIGCILYWLTLVIHSLSFNISFNWILVSIWRHYHGRMFPAVSTLDLSISMIDTNSIHSENFCFLSSSRIIWMERKYPADVEHLSCSNNDHWLVSMLCCHYCWGYRMAVPFYLCWLQNVLTQCCSNCGFSISNRIVTILW